MAAEYAFYGFVVTTGKLLLQERNDLKICDHEECLSVLETAKIAWCVVR